MRRKLLSVGFVALLGIAAFGVSGTAGAGGCNYKGGKNALPTSGLPVLVYGNGDMSPSGFVGVSDGTSGNYVQISGDSSSIQVEMFIGSANANGYANSSGAYGGC